MKKCSRCKQKKPDTDFWKNQKRCKDCLKTEKREARKRNPGYARQRDRVHNLRHNYGLSLEQYDRMFEEQGGVCKICGGTNIDGERLSVDHDHKTGKVRNLLCRRCNTLVGQIETNENVMYDVFKYVGY